MGHTFSRILLHVIFSTKGRRLFLGKYGVEYDPEHYLD